MAHLINTEVRGYYMTDFNELLEDMDHKGMIKYCEDRLNELWSIQSDAGGDSNGYEKIEAILRTATDNCDYLVNKAVGVNVGDNRLKQFAEYIQDGRPFQNNKEAFVPDKIKRSIINYWTYGYIYSYMHAIYTVAEKLQKSVVYDPKLIYEIEPLEAWYLFEIYFKGYITKDEINENVLYRIKEKKTLYLIDDEGCVFLTNMGVTFIRMNEERIIDRSIDVVQPAICGAHIDDKDIMRQLIKQELYFINNKGYVVLTEEGVKLLEGIAGQKHITDTPLTFDDYDGITDAFDYMRDRPDTYGVV